MADSDFVISQDQARKFARAIYADVISYMELHPDKFEEAIKESEETKSARADPNRNACRQESLFDKAAE